MNIKKVQLNRYHCIKFVIARTRKQIKVNVSLWIFKTLDKIWIVNLLLDIGGIVSLENCCN